MNDCLVSPYVGNMWPQVAPLLEAWPFKPLAGHNGFDPVRLLDLTSARVKKAVKNENGANWVVLQKSQPSGFACLSMLPWDSGQIGMNAARIDYLIADGSHEDQHQTKKALLEAITLEARARDIQHLSVRVDASDMSSVHVLEDAGFITVDAILTFALELARHKSTEPLHDFAVRLATDADADAAAELARTAYIYDRFHSDPVISSERADELHATWLRNSCIGNAADAVVLAEDETGLLGFVTCSLQRDTATRLGSLIGTIVLVASAKRARGRGVGLVTTIAALEWFRAQGCEIVEVGTQLRNMPASRLYQKAGFRLVGSSISLRLLLHETGAKSCSGSEN